MKALRLNTFHVHVRATITHASIKLSLHSDGDDFIALQDKMLQNNENKASWDAHKIFERKILNNYYKHFAPSYPEKTLEMFRKEIDQFTKVNLGREHYSKIVSLFKEMVKIKGGKEVVKSMIDQYNVIYKNRKAMMEILRAFHM